MIRSASALAGGLLREVGDVVWPGWFRRTRLYRNLVEVTLRFLIERVGQVEGVYPGGNVLAEDFLLRKGAGNGLEIVGVLAFGASPVWVLAALADLSGVGKRLLSEIAESLCEAGLLERGEHFESMEQILSGLEQTAERAVSAVNTPPLDIKGLRGEWAAIREQAEKIPPRDLPGIDDIGKTWERLQAEAKAQSRSVFEMSALVALSAISNLPRNLAKLSKAARYATGRTGALFASTILDHYAQTLDEIQSKGFAGYWSEQFRPYLAAAARQFRESPKS